MKKAFIIVCLLSLPAIFALFHRGYFPSHDGDWMAIRLSAFHQSLRDGHFPVRWAARLNHGYGYPVLNFLYPLPFYFAEIFYLLSHSLVFSIKTVFGLSFVSASLAMFVWLKSKYSYWPALAGSLLYLYTPYRFVDTYVRGSIGESLGFVFIPFLFWSIDSLKSRPRLAVPLGAIAAAAILLSHNVFVTFPLLALIYGLISLKPSLYPKLFLLLSLGACLSAYFWLPAIFELKYVYASMIQVADPRLHLLSLRELILPSWGYGPSVPGNPDSLSFQVGLPNLVIVIAALIVWLKKPRPQTSLFFPVSFLTACLFMIKVSGFLWQFIPGIAVIQFPWRLLSLTTFVSAVTLASLSRDLNPVYIFAITFIIIAVNLPYARPQSYTYPANTFFSTNEATTTVANEYLPIWVANPMGSRPPNRWQVITGQAQIDSFQENTTSKSFHITVEEPADVTLSSIYYPGWQLQVNNQPTPIDYQDHNGLISFQLPRGDYQVKLDWTETPLRKIADIVSFVSGLLVIGYFLLSSQNFLPVKSKA